MFGASGGLFRLGDGPFAVEAQGRTRSNGQGNVHLKSHKVSEFARMVGGTEERNQSQGVEKRSTVELVVEDLHLDEAGRSNGETQRFDGFATGFWSLQKAAVLAHEILGRKASQLREAGVGDDDALLLAAHASDQGTGGNAFR